MQDVLNLTLAQFYGAIQAEQRANINRIKDLTIVARSANMAAKDYKKLIAELDKGL